jgi:preprotein translocase subunit SecB
MPKVIGDQQKSPNPVSGIRFERIWISHLTFQEVELAPEAERGDGQAIFGAAGGMKVTDDGGAAEIRLQFSVKPNNPKRPYEVQMTINGRFASDDPEALLTFCKSNGPAVMFPYVRTIIHEVSGTGRFGTIVLPLMNMQVVFPPENWGNVTDSSEPSPPSAQSPSVAPDSKPRP